MIDSESNLDKPGVQKQKPPTYPRLAHRYIPIHTHTFVGVGDWGVIGSGTSVLVMGWVV